MSSNKRTKHINVQLYFSKDKIMKKKINVIYYPTGKMIKDNITKLLQGLQFINVRDAIMGEKYLRNTVSYRYCNTYVPV